MWEIGIVYYREFVVCSRNNTLYSSPLYWSLGLSAEPFDEISRMWDAEGSVLVISLRFWE